MNLNDYSPRNPVWATRDNAMINLDLTHPEFGEIKYSCTNQDTVELSVELYNACINGDYGPIAPYVVDITADRQARIKDVTAYRDSLKLLGYPVTVGGIWKWFYSDLEAKINYLALITAGQEGGVPDGYSFMSNWRLMDSTTVDMTYGLLKQVRLSGITQEMSIDNAAETHIANINASSDPINYDFSAGWPATFWG